MFREESKKLTRRLTKLDNIPWRKIETRQECGTQMVTIEDITFRLTEKNVELLELIDAILAYKKSKDRLDSYLQRLDLEL